MGAAGSRVKDYAPEGYELLESNYEGGCVTHVFCTIGGNKLLECRVGRHDDEEGVLGAFKREHSPKPAKKATK